MKNKTPQNDIPISPGQCQQLYPEDEIDLADLFMVLIRQRKIIFIVTLVTTLGALFFALWQPAIYKAEIFFRPPNQADVELLNLQLGSISVGEVAGQLEVVENLTINKEDLFRMFLDELRSRGLRREVFAENYPVDDEKQNTDQVFDGFNKRIELNLPGKKKNDTGSTTVSVTFEDDEPQLAADILNILGEKAGQKVVRISMLDAEGRISLKKKALNTKIDILLAMKKKEINDEIIRLQEVDSIKRKKLNGQISAIKEQAKNKREDRIARLDEAASIAKDSQLKTQLSLRPNEAGVMDTLATMQVTMNSLPLYLYGENLLRAEIKRLKARKSDDPFLEKLRGYEEQLTLLEKNEKVVALEARKDLTPFVPEVRKIQKQLALLEGINFDPKLIRAAIVDQSAYPPVSPIKPKKRLIIVLGLVLGLMAGVFAAFVMNFVANMRQKEGKESVA